MYPRFSKPPRAPLLTTKQKRQIVVVVGVFTGLFLISRTDGFLANGDRITDITVVNNGDAPVLITFFKDKPVDKKYLVGPHSESGFSYYIGTDRDIDYQFYSPDGKLLGSAHAKELSDVRRWLGTPTFVYPIPKELAMAAPNTDKR